MTKYNVTLKNNAKEITVEADSRREAAFLATNVAEADIPVEMSLNEIEMLRSLLRKVVGSPFDTRRRHSDSLSRKLDEVVGGGYAAPYPKMNDITGSIYFEK